MYRIYSIISLSFLFVLQLFSQSALNVSKVSITVSDLESVVPFYEEVLSFKKVSQYEWSSEEVQRLFGIKHESLDAKVVVLQLGEEQIELIQFNNEMLDRTIPLDSKSNDLWFQHIAIVVNDMEEAYKRLRSFRVKHVSTAPQTLPDYIPAAAGISAFYFRDPDGHNLELIHFPKGKGNPKWQKETDELFLGIDHTAIGISNTDVSAQFYQEELGLKVAGNSENYGTQQERLNQVFGAHLLITGLQAKEGIGVEFLEYLAPPGGRPYPLDSQPTDLWHWHTVIEVEEVSKVYQQLQNSNYTIISNGLVTIGNQNLFLVRDPDHHALLIIEKL